MWFIKIYLLVQIRIQSANGKTKAQGTWTEIHSETKVCAAWDFRQQARRIRVDNSRTASRYGDEQKEVFLVKFLKAVLKHESDSHVLAFQLPADSSFRCSINSFIKRDLSSLASVRASGFIQRVNWSVEKSSLRQQRKVYPVKDLFWRLRTRLLLCNKMSRMLERMVDVGVHISVGIENCNVFFFKGY